MKANTSALVRKGFLAGAYSGMSWGLDTVLLGVVMSFGIFADNPILVAGGVFLCSLLHDGFAALWMLIIMGFKQRLKEFGRAIRTRDGLFCMLGALFGGPLAMTFYILAIAKGGAALTATVTACYPLLGSALAVVILKEKMSVQSWLGLLVCVLGIFWIGYAPGEESSGNALTGILLASVAAIGWATEAVVCGYGMKAGKVDPQMALLIREITSGIAYLIIVPFMLGSLGNVTEGIQAIFAHWPSWLLLLFTALIGMSSFLMWYTGIDLIGAAKALCLNVTYSFWAVLFTWLFFGGEWSINVIIGSLMVMGGVMFATLMTEKGSTKKRAPKLKDTPESI